MPMSLRPISTICWEGHTPPVLFVMADGKSFRLLDLGDERAPDLAEELAVGEAIDWGRDPSRSPPQGWRYASLREFSLQ